MVANPTPVDPVRISHEDADTQAGHLQDQGKRAGRCYSPRSRLRISASRTAMAASAPRSPGS